MGNGETGLRWLRELPLAGRATLIVRHAERETAPLASEDLWPLTAVGREQSRRFGAGMPPFRHLYLTHTRIARTRDTAREIAEGFGSAHPGSEVEVEGIDPALSLTTFYARDSALREQWRERLGDQFFSGWIAGTVPAEAVAPVGTAVADLIARLRHRAERGPGSALHVAVTHDVFVTAIREVLFGPWAGAQPPVGFLEGVLLTWDPEGHPSARWGDRVADLPAQRGGRPSARGLPGASPRDTSAYFRR